MLGKIISIIDNNIIIKLDINVYENDNLIGKNVVFENNDIKHVGEISSIENNTAKISLLGEFKDNKFFFGDVVKPSFKAVCRLMNKEEIDTMYNSEANINSIVLGKSFVYKDYPVKLNINSFFSSHFAILGNTGSGKSYSVAKIFQSIFYEAKYLPYKTNIFLFDAYGEYQQAFDKINEVNPNLNYKVYTTNLRDTNYEKLSIPFWLLGVDDIALLLNADSKNQVLIIEKALKFVCFFSQEMNMIKEQKNDIIARALLDIIFSGKNPNETRNQIISTLTTFETDEINLGIKLTKGGWTRTLRQCIAVEDSGKFADIEVVINFLEEFTTNNFELFLPDGSYKYSIQDFAKALEFALISEGVLSNNRVYEQSNILKIRLNTLINSEYVNYFDYPKFVNREYFIKDLLTTRDGKKCQIINFNINQVDDRFAKSLTKIYSKLLFDYIVTLKDRASFPFHIVLEEAHRYVQNDSDVDILGYNIFERITKEGRKYGILLGIISQRPCEISETAISQCNNFLIFKLFNPRDLEFVRDLIPNVDTVLINKMKTLHPGSCITIGTAFKMPMIVQLDKPNPTPYSDSCNVEDAWYIKN